MNIGSLYTLFQKLQIIAQNKDSLIIYLYHPLEWLCSQYYFPLFCHLLLLYIIKLEF